jgi:hypothetical protein
MSLPDSSERVAKQPSPRHLRGIGIRLALVAVAPLAAYGAIRPLVGSDAAGLALAGVIPLAYNVVLAVWKRRTDVLGVISALGFSFGCLASVLAGGSALPLKLHEAAITFVVGVVLLVAVVARRPVPVSRALRIPSNRRVDSALGAIIGGFLVLHALLHLALVIALPTGSYLIVSKVIDWGAIGLGLLALRAYVHRLHPLEGTGTKPVPTPPTGPTLRVR